MKAYLVYMMTNRSLVVLYTGVTNSLERRLWYHGNTSARSFVKRYQVEESHRAQTQSEVGRFG